MLPECDVDGAEDEYDQHAGDIEASMSSEGNPAHVNRLVLIWLRCEEGCQNSDHDADQEDNPDTQNEWQIRQKDFRCNAQNRRRDEQCECAIFVRSLPEEAKQEYIDLVNSYFE